MPSRPPPDAQHGELPEAAPPPPQRGPTAALQDVGAPTGQPTAAPMVRHGVTLLIEIESTHPVYTTDDVFGLISGGWLRLWGHLEAESSCVPSPGTENRNTRSRQRWAMVINDQGDSQACAFSCTEVHVAPDYFHDDLTTSPQQRTTRAHYLPCPWRQVSDRDRTTMLLIGTQRPEGTDLGIAKWYGEEARDIVMASSDNICEEGLSARPDAFRDGRRCA